MENSTTQPLDAKKILPTAKTDRIQLHPSWKEPLLAEFFQPYMIELHEFLEREMKMGKTIYPKGPDVFNALNECPLENVKVVILGQDPYHGPGQAHGLCFSVQKNVRPPPSLMNIFKELESDLGIPRPNHGHLDKWAKQGVLLLNTVLTVESGKAASHHGKGWENFTDQVIHLVDELPHSVAYLLWGSPAQKKEALIQNKRHLILKSPHPSPLSAYRGFLGNKHFSKTNTHLKKQKIEPIDWSL